MDFGAKKTPVEVIREDAFAGTYFRDIYFQCYWKVVQKMVGFSGILGTGCVEDRKMMKNKLIDGEKL